MTHGGRNSYLLSFSRNLGRVDLSSLDWTYDHNIDPLDLLKVCVLMCSDDLYLKNVSIRSAHLKNRAQ
jgi:hypothetical protein